MRILIVNKYHKITGGADTYALDLARLLHDAGHKVAFVSTQFEDNIAAPYKFFGIPQGLTHQSWKSSGIVAKARAYRDAIYNRAAARTVGTAIDAFKPQLVHLQNIHYQVSPSVIREARHAKVPVVQTLHDYQPVCASNTLEVRGQICEACRNHRFDSILRRRCYNNSAAASWMAFSAKCIHTLCGLYPGGVDRFIAPSRFLKEKIESFNFKMAPIDHVPNYLDPSRFDPAFQPGDYILYFGQLLAHKGIYTLISAAQSIERPLVFAGAGPELERLQQMSIENPRLRIVGYQAGSALHDWIRGARLVVVPSEWYENQPYAVLESFALGKPVVGANIGGIPELIEPDRGKLFPPGDAKALESAIRDIIDDTSTLRKMGEAGREYVIREHRPEVHIERIMQIYHSMTDGESAPPLQTR